MPLFYDRHDTITAIATPPGEGGVAIIRISGADAIRIANNVFTGPVSSYESHTAHYGKIYDCHGVVDSVLVLVMLDGRSYTGEATVEIHCHGGKLITRRVLETVLSAGGRLAHPGEFTYRAYCNGKLDLAQAEAVQALIGAKNERALAAAGEQLQGMLSQTITSFQQDLVEVAAILEAWVDFPEEGLEFTSFEELQGQLADLILRMQTLVDTFHHGQVVREGLALCLAGAPNVGKSSLMNALLDRDRAIVTDIPGTTRDLIEEELRLGRLHYRLMDTAGHRAATDVIEQEGIRRSQAAMEEADVILHVLDAAAPAIPLLPFPHKTILVWNKVDVAPCPQEPKGVAVSAKHRLGLDLLQTTIERLVEPSGAPENDQVLLTNARHKEALVEAAHATQKALDGLKEGLSPELLCIEVRDALGSLGEIIGQDMTEEVLSAIFSRFCLGK